MHIFKPIKQIKASSEVGQQLKNAILGGEYRAGDKLPSERELIELFQVSRTVVREAIKSIEAGGLVEIRQGATGGAFVKHLTFERLSDACNDLFMMGKLSLPELCQARMLIEPQVARMAARNCTPEQALALMEANSHENDSYAYPDTVALRSEVHYLLAEMAGNRFLEAIVKSLLILLRNQTIKFEPPTDEIHPLGLHGVIIDAVIANDEDKAEAEMFAHLEDFNIRLRKIECKYLDKQRSL
ncbi:FadR/GntR family transcriptional regulator [Shewanella baltica]|uniref:FadR/GntR family transcriptional regulator n=1 Tax=Shewanella baltica TaxID=62322 RepID=UPI00217E681A|nr:FadR/GntR family transcriptional regulator [Shewanella baltica]MCS6151937.1 FadR family transcriptional regulator [Shewanella baltica]MCS6207672.1 FadR family transcriptional regulator [Shewanella baltica]